MTPSGLENWFSDLMGEMLLVIIFSVGLPLMYKLATSLKDLRLSVDKLKESLDRTGNNIDTIKAQVYEIEDGIHKVEANQKLHVEKTEHGFQRLRDVITKFRNGNSH